MPQRVWTHARLRYVGGITGEVWVELTVARYGWACLKSFFSPSSCFHTVKVWPAELCLTLDSKNLVSIRLHLLTSVWLIYRHKQQKERWCLYKRTPAAKFAKCAAEVLRLFVPVMQNAAATIPAHEAGEGRARAWRMKLKGRVKPFASSSPLCICIPLKSESFDFSFFFFFLATENSGKAVWMERWWSVKRKKGTRRREKKKSYIFLKVFMVKKKKGVNANNSARNGKY